jgi:hypothetical protein
MKTTITIKLETTETQGELLDAAREAFGAVAVSIAIESEDGTSETIYTRKK